MQRVFFNRIEITPTCGLETYQHNFDPAQKERLPCLGTPTRKMSRDYREPHVFTPALALKVKEIFLQWVPGHCGIWDNEQTDFLAKRGANILQHPNTAISYWRIKQFLKNIFKSNAFTRS